MKKLAIVTTFIKWALAAVGALVVFYLGYNIFTFFTPTVYKGADGKQSDFEKAVPNFAEFLDLMTYKGEYKGADGKQSTFEKYFPNVSEAYDKTVSWLGSLWK